MYNAIYEKIYKDQRSITVIFYLLIENYVDRIKTNYQPCTSYTAGSVHTILRQQMHEYLATWPPRHPVLSQTSPLYSSVWPLIQPLTPAILLAVILHSLQWPTWRYNLHSRKRSMKKAGVTFYKVQRFSVFTSIYKYSVCRTLIDLKIISV